MIECATIGKTVVRRHYDLTTPFYRLFWGRHIHHGLWEASESPAEAQLRLTETLADEAGVRDGDDMLDVGCGMGGSAIHLARTRNCHVSGITISPLQQRWAAAAAIWHRVGRRTEFRCVDAEQVEWPEARFDVIWSIECTEHLYDKARFFRRAAQWLKPGGRVAICAWLAGDPLRDSNQEQLVQQVCEGFFCPSLGTMEDYRQWFTAAGLQVDRTYDWTARVTRTWEICRSRVRRSGVRWLARAIDRDSVLFLDRFDTILEAYRTGAMQYGCLIAHRPLTRPEVTESD